MPSKKKYSKSASRLSKTDQSASPHTPALTPPSKFEVNEQDHAFLIEEASRRYPFLIGISALFGHLTDVVVEQELTRHGTIWLSESAMVASSLAPGCVVSVSLPASGTRSSNIFPLRSISGEYNGQFGAKSIDEKTNGVGNYFALARVSPSSKVLKEGIRLSADLSYTMGCPALGTVVFVYPIQKPASMGLEDGNKKSPNSNDDNVSFHSCNELHLELVSFTDRVNGRNSMTSTLKLSSESTCDQSENGIVSSPQTPPCQPMLSSPSTSQIASTTCEKSTSTSSTTHFDFFDIKEFLKDEHMQHFHQAWAASRLHSRILICGNLVAIPMLRYHFIFRVIGANKLPASTSQEPMKEVSHCSYSQTTKSVKCVKDAFLIDCKTTKVHLYPSMSSTTESPKKGLPFLQVESKHLKAKEGQDTSKLGGLDKEYAALKDLIASSTKNTLSSLGIRTTKGVLLHGPPGTGKTSLAQLCTHDAGVNLFSVNGPEIISQYYGESEQEMHKVFDSASQAAPSVVFIDELDAIAPARKDGSEELSQRMVATLLNLMDGINKTDGLLVIAATNRADSVEPALRRPGRFDREIEIGVPSPQQRLGILHSLLGKVDHSLSDTQIQHLAMVTHGFVGADLAALVNEAALVCLRRYDKSLKPSMLWHPKQSYIANGGYSDSLVIGSSCLSEQGGVLSDFADSSISNVSDLPVSMEILPSSCAGSTVTGIADNFEEATSCKNASSVVEDCTKVAFEDFHKARMKVRPSAMREVILEVPKVNWGEVGGQREVKSQLMEAVEWPQRHQDAFKRIGIRPPTGVLMFGPPGCSKTLMARAVASEARLNFLAVKGPELFSKWVGESEKAVRSLFAKARANAPSVIFFDEIDGLAVTRGKESNGVSVSDRVMSQLLVELDGLHQRVDVTVIAATNRPEKIDPALLRPGRFDRLLYVGPPHEADREEIFHIHLHKIPCSSEVNIKELAHLTDGYTGADISLICREAAIAAIEENIDASKVTMEHLKCAIRQVQPTDIQSYEELAAKFQRLVHSSQREGLRSQNFSNRSNWFSIWTPIRSIMRFFHLFLLPSGTKSTPTG